MCEAGILLPRGSGVQRAKSALRACANALGVMNDSAQNTHKADTSHAIPSPDAAPRRGWPLTRVASLRQSATFQFARVRAQRLNASFRSMTKALWSSPHGQRIRVAIASGRRAPYSGALIVVGGVALVTVFIALLERVLPAPNPGVIYLPLAAFVTYYWNLRYGVATSLLALLCIYLILIPPAFTLKTPDVPNMARLLTDAAVLIFILALARLAANRNAHSGREVSRFASLTSIGLALDQ